jgi:MoxR-like ATPase
MYGPPGVGKTDTGRELPDILASHYGEEFGFVIQEATAQDGPDVLGFLVPVKDPQTGEAIARYTKPDLIRKIEATGLPNGIVFIDEIGQADNLVQKAYASLFLEGRLGEYTIPEGWFVIGASNRVEDRAGAVKPLSHFVNRQCRVDIDANIEDWLMWARQHKLHHMMTGFASFRPGVVMTAEVPAKPGAYCTPRSFTAAARFMSHLVTDVDEELPNDIVTQQMVAGYIGEAASAELFSFLKTNEFLPTWKEILANPETAKVPPHDRLDAAYAAASLVTQQADGNTLEPAFLYATRLPVEMQTSVARTLAFVAQHRALILNSID